ncbi:MAG: hypothetical protein CVU39_20260 [Chloroflexi bacterium HGW-Chloroflexi-10]|nr:MAG: hypothetical protein CVU39_20260 [Chloroflexi bacterium HGW-Chloroflexi-10]
MVTNRGYINSRTVQLKLITLFLVFTTAFSLLGMNVQTVAAQPNSIGLMDTVCTDVSLIASEDTYLSAGNVTYNNGGSSTFNVDATTGTSRRAALLKWDLSGIPANATVSSASLSLNVTAVSDLTFNLYNMKQSWVEGTSDRQASSDSANWNTYNGVTGWGTVGAASTTTDRYDTNLWGAGTSSFNSTGSKTVTLNSDGVSVVEGWINGSTNNYGLVMQNYSGTTSDAVTFSSSEATTAANRPKLNISYCVTSGPTITTTGTLAAFSTQPGVASATQTYTVAGTGLTNNITITAPAGFQLSTNGTDFSSSLTLPQSGGTVATTTIYARLYNATEGTFNGNITHNSSDATTVNVAVSGEVSNTICTDVSMIASEDTYLSGGNTSNNYGSQTYLRTTLSNSSPRGTLLKWNLSSIPTDSTVSNASLTVNVSTAASATYYLYNMRQNWVEGTGTGSTTGDGATWLTYDGSNAWGTSGAASTTVDRYNTNLWGADSSSFSSTGSKTVNLNTDGKAVVQGWIAGTTNNHGLTIQNYASSSTSYDMQISSNNNATAANRPKLNITYCYVPGPTINITGALTAFSTQPGVASSTQSYTVSGSSLSEGIVITAPSDFQVSTFSDSGFSSTLTLAPTGGVVSAAPIYVRFNRPTAGSSSGNITHTSSGATEKNVAVSGTASNGWIAYNDMNPVSAGDENAVNVTEHTYTTSAGVLKNFITGDALPITITGSCINGSGSPISCESDFEDYGGQTNSGTDAANVFGPDGAIVVDLQNMVQISNSAYDDIITFNNLDPTREYAITLSTNRDDTDYANIRFTRVTIEGAETFTNASSTGVVTNSESSVSFSSGYNTVNGYVAKWTGITSGTDGSFSIKSEWDNTQGASGGSNTKGYAMTAFKLEEISSDPVNQPPQAPVLVQPSDGAVDVSIPPTLEVTVSDPDDDEMDVTFYGRETGESSGENFTLIALPDTQNYSTSYPATFTAQTQWIADNQDDLNIEFVTHLGDLVNTASSTTEYDRADTSMDILDTANVPYSVGPGNHDTPTTLYNTYFGTSRFSGKSYYGGYYGSNNDNNYSFFSASGMDFILINLQFEPGPTILDWADALLKTYSSRRAIVVSHSMLNTNATWSFQGIYDALKDNPNLFLMLCGHMHGESRRSDTYEGNTINTLLSDYQSYTNGGNGYLRIMEFSPVDNKISVKTYSPTVPGYLTDADSQFELDYAMSSTANFEVIGTVDNVSSGSNASISWGGLSDNTEYEWYAVANDGATSTTSDTWSFTTEEAAPTCYALTLSHSGSGSNPSASPANSTVCSAGEYVAGASISLSGAVPSTGWHISGWTGTTNNGSTAATNTVTMPVGAHAASVTYTQDEYTLSITTSGSGSVTKDPAQSTYHYNDAVTLTAVPENGWQFSAWSDGLSGSTNPAVITMNGNKSVTATFTAIPPTCYALTLSHTGSGSNPSASPANSTGCSAGQYVAGATISLSGAVPSAGWQISGWTGTTNNDSTAAANTVTMPANAHSVGVNYTAIPNHAPALTAIGNKVVNELVELTFTATATDEDLDDLNFSLVSAPAGAAITADGAFTWTPTEAQGPGSHPFTVKVCDAAPLCDEEEITVTVNEVNTAPVLTAIGNKSVNKLATLTFTATATDGDLPANTLTFSLVGAPAGATITTAGAFSWTPTEAQGGGDHTFIVKVCDDGSPSLCDQEEITITVLADNNNHAPVLTTIGNKTVNEQATLTFTAEATDEDLDILTFSLTNPPTGATMTAAGAFAWTPTEAQGPADYPFTVRVCDDDTTPLCDEELVTVTVNEANTAPVLAGIGNKTVNELATLTFTATASDSDLPANNLTFSLVNAPTGAVITTAGAFTWTPLEVQGPGNYTFTVRVCDNATVPLCDEEEITVLVNEVNMAPVLGAIGNKTVNELATLTFTATASDSDLPANNLTFSLVNAPTGAAITTTGMFTWTPAEAQGPGGYTFIVKVCDNAATPLCDEEHITVTVNEINLNPVASDDAYETVENTQLVVTAPGVLENDVDQDNDSLTVNKLSGPTHGALTLQSNGSLTYTPEQGFTGTDSFTYTVSDGKGGSDTATATINVLPGIPVTGDIFIFLPLIIR